MKKVLSVIIVSAVLFCCIFAAGCVEETNPDVPDDEQNPVKPVEVAEVIEPAYSVTVTTSGLDTYSTGDIFELQIPENSGSTGYKWIVIEGNEILCNNFYVPSQSTRGLLGSDSDLKHILYGDIETEIKEGSLITGEGLPLVGTAGVCCFRFQPSKAGDYKITLMYMRPWENKGGIVSYTQIIHVVDSNEPSPDGAKTQYVFDSFNINPAAGEYVKVIKTANLTTGYFWEVSGEGLNILTDYKVANPELAGSSGQYEWYAAAEKAGDYIFKAVYKHAGSDEVLSYFEIPLKFV